MSNKNSHDANHILSEGTQRSTGKSAQKMNILAARLIAETVRSTLGPKGMDKMLVDQMGEITVTNDGVTILREISVDHPSAKMIIEIAKTQEEEVGDGTTTAVILAGEFLRRAEELLDSGIHPTIIAKGYRLANDEAIKILKNLAKDVKLDDKNTLIKIAETAMTGKGAEDNRQVLANLVVSGLLSLIKHDDTNLRDNISVKRKVGSNVSESELIEGVVIDKEKVHPDMPSKIKDAKILLLDSPLEIKSTASDAKISVNSPEMMQSFIDVEEKTLKSLVAKVKATGANVLVCQKGIDDLAQYFLAKEGIYAIRRVKRSDMKKLSEATGARIVSDLEDLENVLGLAGIVEQVKSGDDDYITIVKECKDPRAISILVKGTTSHVADETARAVEDAIGDVASVLESKKAVPGAGSIEIELSKELKKFANKLKGREQLAVNSFAESFEIIPKTLAENAGLDSINVLAELKHAHDSNNDAGINVFTGAIMNSWNEGVIEPLKTKVQAINSASEVANMILRIDDIILSEPEQVKNKDMNSEEY